MNNAFPGCEDAIHNQNPDAMICSDQHCTNFAESETFHAGCNTFGQGHPLYPISTAQCLDPATGNITEPIYNSQYKYYSCPPNLAIQQCYCCCSCLANGTPIAIPDGIKPIEAFQIGDAIMVGARDAAKLSWQAGTVKFSSGSDAGWPSTMMFIGYADTKKLIASIDHLFLLASGKLKRADRIVPHQDQLLGTDGTALDITSSASGKWTKGLHHVATDLHFTGTIDGHLINTAGIVSGDYCLQINQHELLKMGLMDEASPAHGSAAFAAANPHLDVTRAAAVRSGAQVANLAMPEGFTAFNPSGTIPFPAGAAQLFTDAQEADIVANKDATFRDLHNDSGFDAINYLVKVFKGFYPDVTILVDQASPRFNTFAYELAGQKTLLIGGEIMRLDKLYADGYKFIVAQGVARLLGATPTDRTGFTYTAAADFYATSSVFRQVFYLDSDTLPNNALTQMQMVFGFISEANAAGDPDNLANDPAVPCRIGSITTGIFGGDVLPCACSDLALLTAMTDSADPAALRLELVFNREIDPASVLDLYNYAFACSLLGAALPKVVSAQVDASAATTIVLTVTAPLKVPFTVTVVDIKSTRGSLLGSEDSAGFSFLPPATQ